MYAQNALGLGTVSNKSFSIFVIVNKVHYWSSGVAIKLYEDVTNSD